MRILTINTRHIRTMLAFRRCATSTAVTVLRALRSNQVNTLSKLRFEGSA